ncbi:MAG: alginate lyase family protein [Anaerolineaceae bacterium]
MNQFKRIYLILKELGASQLIPFALYQAQLKSKSLENNHSSPSPELPDPREALSHAFLFYPSHPLEKQQQNKILSAAQEICSGVFHPFSGDAAPLDLSLPVSPLNHWTFFGDMVNGQDIKSIWEPARFTWSIPLCQAYQISSEDRFAFTFWQNFEKFVATNPENMGPNWTSAQECALRLLPWLMAAQTFQDSKESTPERILLLTRAIWQHASRIALTLNYSRSQNNNHLLSESLGLMLAGLVFSEVPEGKRWLKQGFSEFQKGILKQIEEDGTYSQHSNNYHRLLLHLALIFKLASARDKLLISPRVEQRLAQATRWLLAQLDISSGSVPNLGHNDGTNLLPLGNDGYHDYRPTLQAASRAFLGAPCLSEGSWDELSVRMGLISTNESMLGLSKSETRAIDRIGNTTTWATLRSVQFHSRPAHADLLSIELWHNGQNLLADAGTYAYNLPDPWQNRLSSTIVHNTVSVNDQDQMIRDGKFLWLDRASSFTLPPRPNSISAILYCNTQIAYTQSRSLVYLPGQGFEVFDQIDLARVEKKTVPVTIQFVLPDWQWSITDCSLTLKHGQNSLCIKISGFDPADHSAVTGTVGLIRAGETLLGSETNPIRGWVSPTYLVKKPALSFSVTFQVLKALEIKTQLIL